MSLVNRVMEMFMKKRIQQIQNFMHNPHKVQEDLLFQFMGKARNTVYGKAYDFDSISTYTDFANRLPMVTYEEFEPYIERARKGEKDISWPGRIKWFAKSSGTTNARSKFIPISHDSLQDGHYASGKMMFAIYLHNHPDTQIFKNKNLRLGGSSELYEEYDTSFGDLSAILIDNLPFYAEFANRPNKKLSLMTEWEAKLESISKAVLKENIGCFTGVPSWMLVLLNRILEKSGHEYLDDLWPQLEVFFHGGISFKPYTETYQQLARKQLRFYELYNASEGFFGIQDQSDSKEMLLLLDNGSYYEFIPMNEWGSSNPKIIPLSEVELGKNYAVLLTTNGGLWRYAIGDTVRFTSLAPYRILVSGRTKHFINAFGEELIIENAEIALEKACKITGAIVKEYTAGPEFMTQNKAGLHEWIVEFERSPKDIEQFVKHLDDHLQAINSDYAAKRYNDMTLRLPKIHVAPNGFFFDWMESRGKLGGQNKVPRLSNDRTYIDPLLNRLLD